MVRLELVDPSSPNKIQQIPQRPNRRGNPNEDQLNQRMENVKKANESLEYMKTTAVGNQKNGASYQQLLTDAYTSAQFLLT